jgi:hypothetical protein
MMKCINPAAGALPLEDKPTKVAVSSDNVISLFLLTKLVAVVLRDVFSRFTDE